MAVVEAYPDLKATGNIGQLQEELTSTENKIGFARQHIAVTTGLLATVNREELQAVIAHEIGHVKNFDMPLMMLMAGLVGAVALISNGLGRVIFRGGIPVRGGSGGGETGTGERGEPARSFWSSW